MWPAFGAPLLIRIALSALDASCDYRMLRPGMMHRGKELREGKPPRNTKPDVREGKTRRLIYAHNDIYILFIRVNITLDTRLVPAFDTLVV